jgi:hypothetical protein
MGLTVMTDSRSFQSTQAGRKKNIELFFNLYLNEKGMLHLKTLLTNYVDIKVEKDMTPPLKGEQE